MLLVVNELIECFFNSRKVELILAEGDSARLVKPQISYFQSGISNFF